MFIRMRFRSRVSKRGTQRANRALGAAREWIKGVGAPLGKMYRLKRRLCGKIKLNLTEKLLVSMLGSKLFRRPSYLRYPKIMFLKNRKFRKNRLTKWPYGY